jgi:hypothetical protein
MPVIAWAVIEAEARAGDVVEVCRKYVGRRTDETLRDSKGRQRPISVTNDSFARHLGINRDQLRAQLQGAPKRRGERTPVALPKPPSDEAITAYLTNRDRDAADPAEREAAMVELGAAEAERMELLADMYHPTATRGSGDWCRKGYARTSVGAST